MSFRKQKIIIFLALAAIFCFFVFTDLALAQAVTADTLGNQYAGQIGLGQQDIRTTIASIIRTALGLLGIVVVVLMIYAGYMWMTAGGDDEKINQAKKILINSVIGLAIILSAYAITSYIISKLIDATTDLPLHCRNGQIDGDLGETDTDCGGPDCPACQEDCVGPNCGNDFGRFFYINSLFNGGDVCVRNFHPTVTFTQDVQIDTVTTDIFYITRDSDAAKNKIPGTWRLLPGRTNIAEFIPTGACGNAGGNADCLDATTNYTFNIEGTLANRVKSIGDTSLSCAFKPENCRPVLFKTGANVDEEAPSTTIRSPMGDLQKGDTVPVVVDYEDDNGIQNISLFDANHNNRYIGTARPAVGHNCDIKGTLQINWPTADQALGIHTLRVDGLDWSGKVGSDAEDIDLRGAECYADPPVCGGACGGCGGDDCTRNADCASGYCDPATKKCVDKMRIMGFGPKSGAPENFVTLAGRYFGTIAGKVYFASTTKPQPDLNTPTDWIEARLADCGAAAMWTNRQITVKVPLGATDGPLKVVTAGGATIFTDLTNDDWGPNLGIFDVNTEVRPKLCEVAPSSGVIGDDIELRGRDFKNFTTDQETQVLFGEVAATISRTGGGLPKWDNVSASTTVPGGLAVGNFAVKIKAKMADNVIRESNTLRFSVTQGINSTLPFIDSITPERGAAGEYITITGQNFGAGVGTVWFKLNGEGDETNGNMSFPKNCNTSLWTDKKILVKFPAGLEVGDYSVQVLPAAPGSEASPMYVHRFKFKEGDPNPGICSISPASGPIPLPVGTRIEITGEYLQAGSSPKTYFSKPNSDFQTGTSTMSKASFVNIDLNIHPGQAMRVVPDENTISGPVIVERVSDSKLSNALHFEKLICKKDTDCTVANTKCCADGTCQPRCRGEKLNAGYVWRFSTREIPNVPRVVEECSDVRGRDGVLSIPSPSPSIIWNTTTDPVNDDNSKVCRTALITVKFNTAIKQSSITDNIAVRECPANVGGENGNSCDDPSHTIGVLLAPGSLDLQVASTDGKGIPKHYLSLKRADGQQWVAGKWYQVVLFKGITSDDKLLGTTQSVPLAADKPCDVAGGGMNNTAYCFVFKAGDKPCALKSLLVTPESFLTTTLTGVNGPIRYKDGDGFMKDLKYKGLGQSDQRCILMSMDGYGWKWRILRNGGVADVDANADAQGNHPPTHASIFGSDSAPVARVSALENTVGANLSDPVDAVNVEGEANSETMLKPIAATSPLTIDLSNPEVIDNWPKCQEACTNAEVGVKFNMSMSRKNFSPMADVGGAVQLLKCDDEVCLHPTPVSLKVTDVQPPSDSENYTVIKIANSGSAATELLPDTWYKAIVSASTPVVVNNAPLSAANPVEKSVITSLSIGGNRLDGANSVFVSDKYAYVAATDDGSLSIIDISDPDNLTAVGYIKQEHLAGAKSVYVSDKYAYVASYVDFFGDGSLTIIDITNPVNPTEVGNIEDGVGATSLAGSNSVYIFDKYAYVAAAGDGSLSIIDISDPAIPKEVGVIVDNSSGGVATQLAGASSVYILEKNAKRYAYVVASLDNALSIIDVTDPTNPKEMGTIVDDVGANNLAKAVSVFVLDKYAYVASFNDDALSVFDISNPANPTQLGTIRLGSTVNSVFVSGKYAYVTSNWASGSFFIIDITDPTNLIKVGTIRNSVGATKLKNASSVFVSGGYAYAVSPFDNSLTVIGDIGIPSVDASASVAGEQVWSMGKVGDLTSFRKPYDKQFTWRFKTKKTACLVDHLGVEPAEYVAETTKAKVIYNGQAFSSPDSCEAKGQKLNPWKMDWSWVSSDDKVAIVHTFRTTKAPNKSCTDYCVRRGSDLPKGAPVPLCGNGVEEAGEDCDPPKKGVCSLNCLLVGNSAKGAGNNQCGNSEVEVGVGEECDPPNPITGCSATCLNLGSKPKDKATAADVGALCGNGGKLALGEDCDVGITALFTAITSAMNCSPTCLHTGTKLAKTLCDGVGHGDYTKDEISNSSFCSSAASICGDGISDPEEDPGCETEHVPGEVSPDCTDSCTKKTGECDPLRVTEGCSSAGTWRGSSIFYTVPSVCGDGVPAGTGEDPFCETGFGSAVSGGDPKVLVEGVGNGTTLDNSTKPPRQLANIVAEVESPARLIKDPPKTASGKFIIPCGYTTDQQCRDATDNPDSVVAINSCCYTRARLVSVYPATTTPPNIRDGICPNTYLEATFDQPIDEKTLSGNFIIAKGIENRSNGTLPVKPVLAMKIYNNKLFTVENNTTLRVSNISNPSSPEILGSIDVDSIGSIDTSVAVDEKYAYILNKFYLRFINITDPLHLVNDKDVIYGQGEGDKNPGRLVRILSKGEKKYAFILVGNSDPNFGKLVVLDITNPQMTDTKKVLINNQGGFSLNNPLTAKISGNNLFVGLGTGAVEVLDITDPENPSHIGIVALPGAVSSMSIAGNRLYAVSKNGQFFGVINIASSTSPRLVGSINNPILGSATDVVIGGKLAYLSTRSADRSVGSIERINISSSTRPMFTTNLGRGSESVGGIYSVNFYNDYVILGSEGSLNFIYDLTCEGLDDVSSLIASAPQEKNGPWYARLWDKTITWLRGVFLGEASAGSRQVRSFRWCAGDDLGIAKVVNDPVRKLSRVVVNLDDALAGNTEYAIILKKGVKDTRGISIGDEMIKNEEGKVVSTGKAINWKFATVSEICAVDSIKVNPAEYLFSTANTAIDLQTQVFSASGQTIQATASYDWNYIWSPIQNGIVSWTATNEAVNRVSSGSINGDVTVRVSANVLVAPASQKKGRVATAESKLSVNLCENAWPPKSKLMGGTYQQIWPYEDKAGNNDNFDLTTKDFTNTPSTDARGYYNFSTFYCADSGAGGNTYDDLPYLRPAIQTTANALGGDETKKCAHDLTKTCKVDGDCGPYAVPYMPYQLERWPGAQVDTWKGTDGNPDTLICFTAKTNDLDCQNASVCPREFPICMGGYCQSFEFKAGEPDVRPCDKATDSTASQRDLIPLIRNTATDYPKTLPDTCQLLNTTFGKSLKRFILTNDKNSDAVGIQIFPNPSHLNLKDWYATQNLGGSLGVVKVAGYDALADNNNVYIDAVNIEGGVPYTNVYLFSINANAKPETHQVFEQLVKNLKFNINTSNKGYCSGNSEINCQTDFDCPTGQTCYALLDKMKRNFQRLRDLSRIKLGMDSYAAAGHETLYPDLKEGSLLTGQSISTWPSWSAALSNAFGSGLPTDPINRLGMAGTCASTDSSKNPAGKNTYCLSDNYCGAFAPTSTCNFHDAATGWTTYDRRFSYACATSSLAYRYIYDAANEDYSVRTRMESTVEPNGGIPDATWNALANQAGSPFYIDLSSGHFSLFDPNGICNGVEAVGEIVSIAQGSCGDKIVQAGKEQCDPPGSEKFGECDNTNKVCALLPLQSCNSDSDCQFVNVFFGPCVGVMEVKVCGTNPDSLASCQWISSSTPTYDGKVARSHVPCSYTKKCGNGKKEAGEQCDLGTVLNNKSGSGCDNSCRLVTNKCGNGNVDSKELCDWMWGPELGNPSEYNFIRQSGVCTNGDGKSERVCSGDGGCMVCNAKQDSFCTEATKATDCPLLDEGVCKLNENISCDKNLDCKVCQNNPAKDCVTDVNCPFLPTGHCTLNNTVECRGESDCQVCTQHPDKPCVNPAVDCERLPGTCKLGDAVCTVAGDCGVCSSDNTKACAAATVSRDCPRFCANTARQCSSANNCMVCEGDNNTYCTSYSNCPNSLNVGRCSATGAVCSTSPPRPCAPRLKRCGGTGSLCEQPGAICPPGVGCFAPPNICKQNCIVKTGISVCNDSLDICNINLGKNFCENRPADVCKQNSNNNSCSKLRDSCVLNESANKCNFNTDQCISPSVGACDQSPVYIHNTNPFAIINTDLKTKYALDKMESCNWDCKTYGPYCGDGIVQSEFGEECDKNDKEGNKCSVGNVNGVINCSSACAKDNTAAVGSWRMEQITSNLGRYYVFDISNQGLDARCIPDDGTCPSFVKGHTGKAASFNGAQWLTVANSQKLSSTKFSVEAWVKPATTNDSDVPILKKGQSSGYALTYNWGNQKKVSFIITKAANAQRVTSAVGLDVDTWSHVVGTFDGENAILYINGALQGGASVQAMTNSVGELKIGSDAGWFDPSRYYKGGIDEVSYYNRVLDPAEIKYNYDHGWFCSTTAAIVNIPAPVDPNKPRCGDGKVDPDEACDKGDGPNGKNGIACAVSYNKSCTYCASDCKNVIEVKPNDFCGDGKINSNMGELCETDPVTKVVWAAGTSTLTFLVPVAPDAVHNGFKVKTCVEASQGIDESYFTGDRRCIDCSLLVNGCVQCGLVTADKGVNVSSTIVNALWPAAANTNPLSVGSSDSDKYNAMKLYASTDALRNDDPSAVSNFENNGADKNKAYFVSSSVHSATAYLNPSGVCMKDNDHTYKIKINNDRNHIFNFPISAARSPGQYDIVVSPVMNKNPKQEDDVRIVATWFGKESSYVEGDSSGFVKNEFNGGIAGAPRVVIEGASLTAEIRNAYYDQDDTSPDGIWLHGFGDTTASTFVTSYTVDTARITKDAAFYVRSNGPISNENGYLKVEVYLPDPAAEDNTFSRPSFTYYLNEAETSENPEASYWHVLNIKRDDGVPNVRDRVAEINQIRTSPQLFEFR